ncbi:hypothetical protein niasHS_000253 [Heterodera schachtii]|uniref:polynucleotide adenylyltransferase n=1 Tax=Heterodera schachtii TaxID=97005 RepID=A0ABD2KHK6_HETSC
MEKMLFFLFVISLCYGLSESLGPSKKEKTFQLLVGHDEGRLWRQIDQDGANLDQFRAMKAHVLIRAGPNQQQKLHNGVEYRCTYLEALLSITEHFWAQLDKGQQRIGTVRQRADTFGAGEAGDEQAADDHEDHLEEQLQKRQTELQTLQNAIEECAVDVQKVTTDGLELCSRMDAEEERSFVEQHLAMLRAKWDTLLAQYTQISGNLSTTMDQLHNGVEYRCTYLEALLSITEHFWAQLDKGQQRIGTVRQRTDTFGAGEAGDEQAADDHEDHLEEQLQKRQTELQTLQNAIEECAVDVQKVLYQLNKRLIDTRNLEEIRGGGLLKYCHLLTREYSATANCRDKEKYMCSRFFIDFPDINMQELKLLNNLENDFGNKDEDFERVHESVFTALLEMKPSATKQLITTDTLRDVYIRKMVNVTDGQDRWSLFSLHNDYGR